MNRHGSETFIGTKGITRVADTNAESRVVVGQREVLAVLVSQCLIHTGINAAVRSMDIRTSTVPCDLYSFHEPAVQRIQNHSA